MPKLQEIQINRCFKPENFGEVRDAQLHWLSNGSCAGYGAVVYLRLVDDRKKIHCAFVIGKARLAPIREITIPRLKLSAALISSKLSKMVCEELEYKQNATVYWTDSTSVLKCLNNETKRFHTFESNRLTTIREHTSPSHWRYVPSKDNPADDALKGLKIESLIQNGRWMNGPEFLWKEENHWPQMITVPQMKDNDPEVRKETWAYTTATTDDVLGSLIEHYSTWWKLLRAIARLIRFKNFLRNKSTSNEHLSVSEIQEAERVIVQHVQKTSFPKSYQIIESRENGKLIRPVNLKKESTIWRLNPKMKNGVMVVGSRLANASVEENAKHSRILPKKHHVTNLIVEEHHNRLGHMGHSSVLSSLRREFWIVKGNAAVRRIVRKCVECQKQKAQPGEQLMADLPSDRVTPNKPPFSSVGIDYFGRFEVKQGRSRVKRYGCVFTCLAMRAVHIEVTHTLNTDSMINALRRFISVRGYPERIRKDCGTNFTSAEKELKAFITNELNQEKIHKFCSQRRIEWIFNPPGASPMGGAWERIIRSVHKILNHRSSQHFEQQVCC